MNPIVKKVALLGSALALAAGFTGCVTTSKGPYHSKAYRPNNPKAVVVKVSLSNKMVYVMEGNRALLVTPTTIGKPDSPTPKGSFRVFNKIEHKRSNSYGFRIPRDGSPAQPVERRKLPGGDGYVGFPMPYWVEFTTAYGFHAGGVWPEPRSHGCLRLHTNVAPKFFALVNLCTPVYIADSQPEDASIGRNVPRPTDYADPDPPVQVLISDGGFPRPQGPLFEEGPAPTVN